MEFEVDSEIKRIVEKAFTGEKLDHDELVALCDVDEYSLEGHYIRWAGRKMNSDLTDGYGELHAQIGLDSNLCQRNCQFCSFAEINNSRETAHAVELPLEQVRTLSQMFVDEGVNVVSLMATAKYSFDKYIEYLSAVREVVGPDMPIMVNIDDFDLEQAKRLKQAGGTFVYHALRLGEGTINEIPPERRIQTMKNAKAAGMKLAVGLEMIDPRWTSDDVATGMETLLALEPFAVTATGMVPVPGTLMADDEHYTLFRYDLYNDIMRLAAGPSVRYCCNCNCRSTANNGNVVWAEFGPNPRDDSNATEVDGIGMTVNEARKQLTDGGWKTFNGPSKWWME